MLDFWGVQPIINLGTLTYQRPKNIKKQTQLSPFGFRKKSSEPAEPVSKLVQLTHEKTPHSQRFSWKRAGSHSDSWCYRCCHTDASRKEDTVCYLLLSVSQPCDRGFTVFLCIFSTHSKSVKTIHLSGNQRLLEKRSDAWVRIKHKYRSAAIWYLCIFWYHIYIHDIYIYMYIHDT